MNMKTHIKLSIALEVLVMEYKLIVRPGIGEVPKELTIVNELGFTTGFINIWFDGVGYWIARKDLQAFAIQLLTQTLAQAKV